VEGHELRGGAPGFRPAAWMAGGHRQTLLGYWCRRRLSWTLPAEDVWVDAGDDVRLLLRATWQLGAREARPILLIVHGLGSSDQGGYVVSIGRLAFAEGWHVVRMNMRGAGDSEASCPRFYNAGLDTDVLAVLDLLAAISPRVAMAGFSLGASVSLLALGRRRERIPAAVRGMAAVSPPLDLGACADALARPGNRFYQEYFMRSLRVAYRRRQRCHPHLYEAGRERGLRTLRDFDERITAPYGGYPSSEDYYARSSAGPWLGAIDRPVLVLAAADDPMIPDESVRRFLLPAPGRVRFEIATTGGHVGFVGPTRAPGRLWAAERSLDFLAEHLGEGDRGPSAGAGVPRYR
jgi:predicted alpha/beta-fold hydrolase